MSRFDIPNYSSECDVGEVISDRLSVSSRLDTGVEVVTSGQANRIEYHDVVLNKIYRTSDDSVHCYETLRIRRNP